MTNPLKEKAVITDVHIRHWTGRKLDRRITDEVNQQHNAEADAGRYNKLLIPREAFSEVFSIITAARTKHAVMTMPWSDKGWRLLPLTLYSDFASEFRKFRIEFDEAADRFTKTYPNYVGAAKKRLNGMFNEDDYPAHSRVRTMFSFNWQVIPCPDAGDFRTDISKEQLEDMRNNLQENMQSAFVNATQEPIRRIINVVEKMAAKLKEYKPAAVKTVKDGADKKKIKVRAENTFRDSLVTNIQELLPLLEAFNLNDDKKLKALVERTQKELCYHEADVLREDKDVRAQVQKSAEEILKQASALMA